MRGRRADVSGSTSAARPERAPGSMPDEGHPFASWTEAALPDLEQAPVEPAAGRSRRPRRARSPSSLTPPCAISRRASELEMPKPPAMQRGQVHDLAVAGAASGGRSRGCRRATRGSTWTVSKRASAPRRRPVAVEPLDDRAAPARASALVGRRRVRIRLVREQELVVGAASPRPGSASACRTSPPAARSTPT